MDKVQTAAHCVTRAAEDGGPMIFTQMGTMQAVHRHHKRVFNPDRKDTHLGETQAEEGPMMDAFDRWWQWATKPLGGNSLAGDGAAEEARHDPERVNEAVRQLSARNHG